MPLRSAAAIIACALMLTGCDTANRYWDEFTTFDTPADQAPPPAAVANSVPPPAPANGPDPFCLAVAQKDTEEGGFDASTQQRMATRTYNQCVGMFRAPPAP